MTAGQRVLAGWPVAAVPVQYDSDVGRVQRLAASAAAHQGLAPPVAQRLSRTAATMASSLATHSRAGQMLVRLTEEGEQRGVELLGMDTAGNHVEAELKPAATASDVFEIYTVAGKGTVMLAQLWNGDPSDVGAGHLVGSMVEPIPGETVTGDAWAIEQHGARVIVLVADGLGHGEQAAVASEAAVAAFRQHVREPVEDIASSMHAALRRTRGAAIALADVDLDAGRLRFCGIGNITARLLSAGGVHELVSLYGIAGYQTRRIQSFVSTWPDDAMLVMHSDGLSSKWDVATYPDLRRQHPQLVAATVMRDATRASDDALVLALRGVHQVPRPPHPGAD